MLEVNKTYSLSEVKKMNREDRRKLAKDNKVKMPLGINIPKGMETKKESVLKKVLKLIK